MNRWMNEHTLDVQWLNAQWLSKVIGKYIFGSYRFLLGPLTSKDTQYTTYLQILGFSFILQVFTEFKWGLRPGTWDLTIKSEWELLV